MNRPLISNILSSFADKAFTAITLLAAMVLMVRLLPRSDFGIIGIVVGYGIFIQIVSLPLENAILREHRSYEQNPEHFLLNFVFFNLLKGVIFFVLGVALAYTLPIIYSDSGFFWAALSITVIVIGESLVSPLVLYASARYQQHIVTLLNFARFGLNLLMLLGLFYWPTLFYVFVKDLVVMSVVAITWFAIAKSRLGLDFSKVSYRDDVDPRFIWHTLTKYSLWVHLTGIATNFIYRADAFFLSFFAPLNVVGNYNVAVTSANVANVAPSILGYQNSVAISHTSGQKEAFLLTDKFLRLSIYIGLATLLGFIFLGALYLRLVTGDETVSEIYSYMICILLGLVIAKTVASPFVAYINVKGDVRRLFLRVNLPTLLFTALTYYLAARYFGPMGVAVSNILNALVWSVLLSLELKYYGYRLPPQSSFRQDFYWVRSKLRERFSLG